jgi:hypothetical protein
LRRVRRVERKERQNFKQNAKLSKQTRVLIQLWGLYRHLGHTWRWIFVGIINTNWAKRVNVFRRGRGHFDFCVSFDFFFKKKIWWQFFLTTILPYLPPPPAPLLHLFPKFGAK